MKKIFSTMAVAAALFAGYSAYSGQNSNELSDVALANVEALASGEGQPGATCYNGYSTCWFWNCLNVFICEIGCPTKSVDKVLDSSTCN